jgi:hypothetical protein
MERGAARAWGREAEHLLARLLEAVPDPRSIAA